jgi:hypothetical protein
MTDSGRFRDFIKAYTRNWFAIMSGGPSVPLAVLTLFVDSSSAKLGLWITAAACIVLSAYFVWRTEHQRFLDAQAKCVELLSDYPHSLRLQKIDVQEDRRVDPTKPDNILERYVRFVLVWKNCIHKPISYRIIALLVDGSSVLENNITEVISGNTETHFYSARQKRELLTTGGERFELALEVTYGQPDFTHTRRTRRTLLLSADFASGKNNFIYRTNTDEPITNSGAT